jgi:magnesium-transporting ATPase (P-type)
MQIKRKLPLPPDDAQHLEDQNLSNVLYAKSYVIKGKGKAIVCAVGHRTQFGMPV